MKIKHNRNAKILLICCSFFLIHCSKEESKKAPTGSVIFIHPDGSGAAMWEALRLLKVGPDGKTNWDNMDRMGLYRGHLLNSTNSSSHGGATVHAYGIKVAFNTYGNNPQDPFKSLSGKDYSIMIEAKNTGKSIALINSGHICEPGTGAFVANSIQRRITDPISEQIINSGADIIFSGGEELLLPNQVIGKHGKPGRRQDGKNLIEKAKELGYKVIYTKDELIDLPVETDKVLGVFSASHTFNDQEEESLKAKNLPLYNEYAPSVAEMTEVALKILEHKGKDFLIVIEEEGSDNFSNSNNARGALEALRRADAAIGVAQKYVSINPNTLLLTAADSDAGGIKVMNVRYDSEMDKPLPATEENGAPIDGNDGTNSLPFIAKPDQFGNRLRFGIVWACMDDVAGGIIAKAQGLNSDMLTNNVDNTDIYRMMYATLFGVKLPK